MFIQNVYQKVRGFDIYLGAIKNSFYDLDETKAADQLNRTIEDLVNKNIRQYLWSYERFRNRSGVEENIYKLNKLFLPKVWSKNY